MARRRGEVKRIKPGTKPRKIPLYTENDPNGAPTSKTTAGNDAAGVNANEGELPLYFPNSPKFFKSRQAGRRTRQTDTSSSNKQLEKSKGDRAGHGRSDVSADVHLGGFVDSGWPLGNPEIATWASRFRFELDAHDHGRMQAMLEQEAQRSRATPGGSFLRTPGGSFRFFATEELVGHHNLPPGSHLKPSRQMEKLVHHGSNRLAAAKAPASNPRESEKLQQAVAAAPSINKMPFEAGNNVAVDVPNSPERSVIVQRLRDLKARAFASPRFGLEDDASYHKELAKLAVGRDDGLNQWLKTSSPLWKGSVKSNISTPVKVAPSPQESTALGELEINKPVVVTVKKQRNSPSPLREHLRRAAAQERNAPITPPSSRFKNGGSSFIEEQILSISKQSLTRNVKSPSPDHTFFLPAAIPFQWEEQPGKPKTIRLSRRVSREAVEMIKYMDTLPSTEKAEISGKSVRSSPDGGIGVGDGGRVESHRYYGMKGHSREASLGRSSRRYSTNEKLEAQIDLDASAAAKFLVEQHDTPLSTPGRSHMGSPAFAVPFKWEDAPGKAKEDAPGKAKVETPPRRPNLLQLPPRLAVPSHRSADSFGRDFRASHAFAGFFAPCMTASSPGQRDRKQSDRALLQSASSTSLPPRAPSPPERRRRPGLVGRCSSLPQQGCQITVSRSAANSPALKPTDGDNLFISSNNNHHPNVPSSPRSILYGPDGSSSSQASASNLMFSSGDLDNFTHQTSKSTSYASIEEDFVELANASSNSLPPGETLKPDPNSSSLRGAPTTSASRNCDSEIQPMLLQQLMASEALTEAQAESSPMRPTRLPYTMPSVAEQVLAACGENARRQLIQDLSPRLLQQYSARRLLRSSNSPASQLERSPANQPVKEPSPSPAYAAALELLSPAVTLMAQRRKGRSPGRPPLIKSRRRPRFMLSICRTFKRVLLGRQRRCKPIEPKLMYRDALTPTAFQFSKPN